MARYVERTESHYPRWALIVEPYNRIRPVLLANLEHELTKGMGRFVLCRESEEMFMPQTFDETNWDNTDPSQSNPRRDEGGD